MWRASVRISVAVCVLLAGILNAQSVAIPSGAISPLPPEISPEGIQKFETLMLETNSRMALIIYKGNTIYEAYWKGAEPEKPVEVWSLSKSMASTAIGFLVDEGKIKSIDEPAANYIPEWKGTEKEKIKISHILDQTSGLKDPVSLNTPEDLLQICIAADPLHPPGEEHRYNNGGCNLLSAIIASASGEDPETYIQRKMWKPMGMSNTSWRRDKGGKVITYAGVQTTARDIAKFGQLFLHHGKWDGKQLLSKDWVKEATSPRTVLEIQGVGPVSEYGLLWWVNFNKESLPHNYSALGLWGNHLTVIPEMDLVGVRLVGNNADGGKLMTMVPQWVDAVAGVVKK